MPLSTRESVAAPRPLRADARRNFEAVLSAARDAFDENGPNASLEDIARRAGVGIATLYRNFPARSDLINAVYVDEVEELCKTADNLIDLPPWDALITWMRRFAAYALRKRALVEGLNRDSDLLAKARVAMYGAGAPLLKRAQEAGLARADLEIGDLLILISGVLSGAYADDAQRERVLQVALDGIRAR
jgi:AcrR family transcriptional regulator